MRDYFCEENTMIMTITQKNKYDKKDFIKENTGK